MARAKASEQRRLWAMNPIERILLSLRLGRRMEHLRGLRRERR
jgi:hypothetical protein